MIGTEEHRAELYRLALLRLLAGLHVLAGNLSDDDARILLPRGVRKAILMVLRPAESAARRLIYLQARKLDLPDYVAPPKREKTARTESASGKKRGKRKPRFRLIDPRIFLEELFPNRRKQPSKPAPKPSTERQIQVRIAGFDGAPDFIIWSEPKAVLSDDDMLDATRLLRRMAALQNALEDLPAQAHRMAREIAKRKAAKPGPGAVPPLRYGAPPGFRRHGTHEVDGVLRDCHWMATRPAAPDSS